MTQSSPAKIRSMTGFGRAAAGTGNLAVVAEVRSVNGRFLKVSFRVPESLSVFEAQLEAVVRSRVIRGSLNVAIKGSTSADGDKVIRVDAEKAARYYQQLEAIRAKVGSAVPIAVADVTRLPGVLIEEALGADAPEALLDSAESALRLALDAMEVMRVSEGAALVEDLKARCELIVKLNQEARERAPIVVEEYRTRLVERIGRLLEKSGVESRPEDIAREVAYHADRCDISEETQRLTHHCNTMLAALIEGGEAGRKLDFVAQEMLREANTLGSKANDAILGNVVIAMKAEIEKIKEQVQNIE